MSGTERPIKIGGQYQGHVDVPLNVTAQARATVQRLARRRMVSIVASELSRAYQTAAR